MLYLILFLILFSIIQLATKIEGVSTYNVFKQADEENRKKDNKYLKQAYKRQKEQEILNKDLRKQLLKNGLL